jgi:hypothetical protein
VSDKLPDDQPEWVMINAARAVMDDFGCVERIFVRVTRDESFDGEWQEFSINRRPPTT